MNPQVLVELRDYLTLLDNQAGRLRLRVDLGVRNHPAASGLGSVTKDGVKGVRNVKLNIFTQTVVLDYDTAIIAPELFDALFAAQDASELAAAADALQCAMGVSV